MIAAVTVTHTSQRMRKCGAIFTSVLNRLIETEVSKYPRSIQPEVREQLVATCVYKLY